MATRLLISSLRRPIPSALGSTSGAHPGGALGNRLTTGLLQRSSPVPTASCSIRDVNCWLVNIKDLTVMCCFGAYVLCTKSSGRCGIFHVLPAPTGGRSLFRGSRSSPKAPRRIIGALLRDVLASSFLCSSAALLGVNKSSDVVSKPNCSPTGPARDHGINKEKRQCTDALIAINLLVHAADVATNRKLTLWGAKDNALIRTGQVWRLATTAVLNLGLLHLTANSLALDDFGPMVEEATGQRKFLAIYCTSALTGSLMSYFFGPQRSRGASGAICGLVGAQAVYTWKNKEFLKDANETLTNLGCCALLNMGIGLYFRHRINNWSHLGGLLGGIVVEWFVGPHWTRHLAKDGKEVYEDRAPIVQLMNSKTTATLCS